MESIKTYPYTLGYSHNAILDQFLEKYSLDMKLFFTGESSILGTFVLIPDISTTLEYLRRNPHDKKKTQFLAEEWEKFSKNTLSDMFSFSGYPIPGTSIFLSLQDANPDNRLDAHPDHSKENVGMGFGEKTPEEWIELYARAFALLQKISPGFSDELSRMIHKIIPLWVSPGKHNSASYSSCIGHLYMSYPEMDCPDLAVLEAIIHESNHNKLNLIMKYDPLVQNTREEIYYSPYRPDARHIHGIYLGLHALVAVYYTFFTAYKEGTLQLEHGWLEKSLIYTLKNSLAIRVLQRYGIYTQRGKAILDEMIEVHNQTLAIIKTLRIEPSIKSRGADFVRGHFAEVAKNYPKLRY